jgi:predicted dithiol-disulfide oxidoreductase (DUF899 family)
MLETEVAHPPVVPRSEWVAKRKELLLEEKELTKHYDRVNALRRRLPMVKVEKEYRFVTSDGEKKLLDLFEGRRQLIVYHFMFDPEWDEGCPGCTGYTNNLGDLDEVRDRDTTFTLISRAPLAKLLKYRDEKGWDDPRASSFGSDFNYDFHVTHDPEVAPIEYNFRDAEELAARGEHYFTKGESHGLSVFFQMGGEVYHTYSAYARGVENVSNAFELLDRTPYGRQEDFEDSPAGWPQKPTYG